MTKTVLTGRDASLLDGDGYPTDDALKMLEDFEGSPADFIELADKMFSDYGSITLEDVTRHGHDYVQVTIVTGGWSGNEAVISVIENSMFHVAFWMLSQRGGRYVYTVGGGMWSDANMKFNYRKVVESDGEAESAPAP
jgi:hypothetical protein